MKLWSKIALGALGLVVVAGGSAAAYVSVKWNENYDEIEGPDLRASADPAVIARGEYLVRGPAHCATCHSSAEDAARVDSGIAVPMRGGMHFITGPLGDIYTANLTPDSATGIGRYTDRQLARMLRHNIKPDGTTSIAPVMPFAMLADADIVAVISYLRSQSPLRNEVPRPTYSAMGKAIRTIAPAFRPVLGLTPAATAPAEAPTLERGEYLARYVGNCIGCHTLHDMQTGEKIGPEFGGGAIFRPEPGFPGHGEGLAFRTVNLTPDSATGALVKFGSKENWVQRFRQGRVYRGSPMPWGPFTRMSDADLEALWVYFNSLQPVRNDVSPSVFKDTAKAN